MSEYEKARDEKFKECQNDRSLLNYNQICIAMADFGKSFSDKQHEAEIRELKADISYKDEQIYECTTLAYKDKEKLLAAEKEINRLTFELDKSRDSHQAIIRSHEKEIEMHGKYYEEAVADISSWNKKCDAHDKIISVMENALERYAERPFIDAVAKSALTALKEFREKQ